MIRFRLLTKTHFRSKGANEIRDSLLHQGDQLSVQVSPDDEETAIGMVLLRNGTAGDAAAEQLVDESAVRAPSSEDFSKHRTVTTPATASGPPDAEAAPLPAEVPAGEPAPAPADPRDPKTNSDAQIIADAREAAATFTASLPSYLAQQVTSRYLALAWAAGSQSML